MTKKICFVIMPFSDPGSQVDNRWDDLYDSLIKPAVEGAELGYQCYRSLNPAGSFMHDITKHLATADVAIGVLTELRPNVMYELGARNALKGKTIFIVQDGISIPSDLNAYIALRYSTATKAARQKLTDTIRERLRSLDSSAPSSDNPVHDNLVLSVTSFMNEWYESENPTAFRGRLERLLPDFVLMIEHVWRQIGKASKPQVQAIDVWKTAVHPEMHEATKQTSLIWTNRGMELKDQHQLEGALKCFDAATQLDPENITAAANRSLVLIMLDRPEDARRAVERAITISADDPQQWNGRGKVSLAQKDFPRAAEAFVRALQLDPASAIYANNAGFAWELAGGVEEAEKYYRLALRVNSQFAHALYNLGTLLRTQSRGQEADDLISRAVEVDPLIGKEVEAQRAVFLTS